MSQLPAEDGTSGVSISDDGRRLAVLGRGSLSVWDLTSATADARRCQSGGMGGPFMAGLNWVDDEHLIADRGTSSLVLFSLKHEMVVWNYQLDPRATTVMIAEMGRGKSETITYRMITPGVGQNREQQATVTPYLSSVRIEVGQQVAWQAATSSDGPPSIITLEQGQTVQSEVDRWQRPNTDFFDRVTIPLRILDPKWRDGLGTTDVGASGLVPR